MLQNALIMIKLKHPMLKRPRHLPSYHTRGRSSGALRGKLGRGKGKLGKGDGKTKFAATSSRTPDGKPICYRYNAKGGCKKGEKCHFAHVCLHCFARHPATQCPMLKTKKDDKKQTAN